MAEIARRHAAAQRGLDFLHRRIAENTPKNTLLLGEQCVAMFFDIYLTASDPNISAVAEKYARGLLATLQEQLLLEWPLPWSGDQLLEVLALVRYEPLGCDLSKILNVAEVALKNADVRHISLPESRVADWQAGQLSSADWFEIMSRAFTYEYAVHSAHPNRFVASASPRLGIREVLSGLRRHVFDAPQIPSATSDFGEAFYLATHAIYWTTAYAPTVDLLAEAPWLAAYVHRSLAFWLSQAQLFDQGVKGSARDGRVYVDLDGIGEAVDVLRSIQASAIAPDQPRTPTERQFLDSLPPLLENASEWLIRMQLDDGSWPHIPFVQEDRMRTRLRHIGSRDAVDEYGALYDTLHATWAVTMGLCDRVAVPTAEPSERVDLQVPDLAARQEPALRHGTRVKGLMREVRFREQEVPKRARRSHRMR